LTQAGQSDDGIILSLSVKDGLANPFDATSVNWEVFPDDGEVTPAGCTKNELETV